MRDAIFFLIGCFSGYVGCRIQNRFLFQASALIKKAMREGDMASLKECANLTLDATEDPETIARMKKFL